VLHGYPEKIDTQPGVQAEIHSWNPADIMNGNIQSDIRFVQTQGLWDPAL